MRRLLTVLILALGLVAGAHTAHAARAHSYLQTLSITCSPTSIARGGTTGCYVYYTSNFPAMPTLHVYWQDGWITTVTFPYWIHAYGNTFSHTYTACGTAHVQAQALSAAGEADAYATVTINC